MHDALAKGIPLLAIVLIGMGLAVTLVTMPWLQRHSPGPLLSLDHYYHQRDRLRYVDLATQ